MEDSSPVKLPGAFIGLFLITALVAVAGFIGMFGTIRNIRFMALPPEDIKKVIALMLVFGSGVILGVVALLSSVLMRVFGSSARSEARPNIFPQTAQPRQIEHPPAMRSVTEHTTRNFDSPLYREPQK